MIPIYEYNNSFDCCSRYYRKCILNCLIHLNPKYCCEFGTFLFQSSHVFSYYFSKYMNDGKLITVDISTWYRGNTPNNTYPVMVYPHQNDIANRHGGIDVYYKDFEDKLKNKSNAIELNKVIIKNEMKKRNISNFDLVFLDSDHSEVGFLSDLIIAKILTKKDGYILIDDIKDNNNLEQVELYNQLKENGNEFYEFDGWNPNPGMALIQNKDLIL